MNDASSFDAVPKQLIKCPKKSQQITANIRISLLVLYEKRSYNSPQKHVKYLDGMIMFTVEIGRQCLHLVCRWMPTVQQTLEVSSGFKTK